MNKTTYKAVAPSGKVFTRRSYRIYTHAVVTTWNYDGRESIQFCGSLELAEKAKRSAGVCINYKPGTTTYTRRLSKNQIVTQVGVGTVVPVTAS